MRRRGSASSSCSASSRPSLVDLGCGSGVVAVAAAKLGFAPVRRARQRRARRRGGARECGRTTSVAVEVARRRRLGRRFAAGRRRRGEHRPRAGGAGDRALRRAAGRRLRISRGGATRAVRAGAAPTVAVAEGWAADLLVRRLADPEHRTAGWASIAPHGLVHRRLPRLQGLTDGRSGAFASGSSPTGTSSRATAARTSRSSTPAASPTRPCGSPARPRAGRPGRRARLRDRLRREPRPATGLPRCRRTSPSSGSRASERRRSSPATSARSAASDANVGLDRSGRSSRSRTAAASRVRSASSRRCAGASRSRPAEAVLREISRRVEQGHREVVLTGINLGCYRDRPAGLDLPRLVRAAGATPGLERLRLSSIEVNHVSAGLLAAMRETTSVSPHLHVPLQSGDDGVLEAMRRRYIGGDLSPPRRPRRGLQPDHGRDRRLPGGRRRGIRADAAGRRGGRDHQGARLSVLAAPGNSNRRRRPGSAGCEEGSRCSPARAFRRGVRAAGGSRSSAARTSCWSIDRAEATATTTLPGSCSAQVGALVRARAVDVSEEGVVGAPV